MGSSLFVISMFLVYLSYNPGNYTETGMIVAWGIWKKRGSAGITFWEIVETLEGVDFMNPCLLGLPESGESTPCPFHEYGDQVKASLWEYLKKNTLLKVQEMTETQGLRITASEP